MRSRGFGRGERGSSASGGGGGTRRPRLRRRLSVGAVAGPSCPAPSSRLLPSFFLSLYLYSLSFCLSLYPRRAYPAPKTAFSTFLSFHFSHCSPLLSHCFFILHFFDSYFYFSSLKFINFSLLLSLSFSPFLSLTFSSFLFLSFSPPLSFFVHLQFSFSYFEKNKRRLAYRVPSVVLVL